MATQIEQLTQAVTELHAAEQALEARFPPVAPDLAPTITAIQGVTASLNALAAPQTIPTPGTTSGPATASPVTA